MSVGKELKWSKINRIELPGGNGGGIWWTCLGCNGGRAVSVSASFGGSGIGGSDIRIEFDFGGFGGLGGGFEWCFAIVWILPFSGIYHFMEITIPVYISWFLYMFMCCVRVWVLLYVFVGLSWVCEVESVLTLRINSNTSYAPLFFFTFVFSIEVFLCSSFYFLFIFVSCVRVSDSVNWTIELSITRSKQNG